MNLHNKINKQQNRKKKVYKKISYFLFISDQYSYPLKGKCSTRPKPRQITKSPIRSGSRVWTRRLKGLKKVRTGALAERSTSPKTGVNRNLIFWGDSKENRAEEEARVAKKMMKAERARAIGDGT